MNRHRLREWDEARNSERLEEPLSQDQSATHADKCGCHFSDGRPGRSRRSNRDCCVEQAVFVVDRKMPRLSREYGKGWHEEGRTGFQMLAPRGMAELGLWKAMESIAIRVRKHTEISATRYGVDQPPVSKERIVRAIGGPWGIRDTCHWSLNATCRTDESRVSNVNMPTGLPGRIVSGYRFLNNIPDARRPSQAQRVAVGTTLQLPNFPSVCSGADSR